MGLLSKYSALTTIQTEDGSLSLFSLCAPIFVENLLKYAMNTVNVLILSRLSDQAVASVGVATQLLTIITMLFTVAGTGATVVISRSLGAGDRQRAADSAMAAIAMIAIASAGVGLLCFLFASPLLRLMQLDEALLPDAVAFFRIAAGLCIFQSMITILSAIARSYGKAKAAMLVSLVMNLLNAAGGFWVVLQPIPLPLQGVAGVATARITAECISLLVLIRMFRHLPLGLDLRRLRPFPISYAKDILRIALPSGVESVSYNLSQTVATAIIALLGVVAVSSKIYIQNISYYIYLPAMAVGQATAIMIGRLAGAGEYGRMESLGKYNLSLAMLCNAALSLTVIALRRPLLGLFTSDPDILSLAGGILVFDFFIEVGRALNLVGQGCLRATGDVRFPMAVSLCTSWTCSILLAYLLGVVLELGLIGCWIAFTVEEVTRGTLLILRWRSGKWRGLLQKAGAAATK